MTEEQTIRGNSSHGQLRLGPDSSIAPTITIERSTISLDKWEAFAFRCDVSHRGVGNTMRLWQIKQHRFFYRTSRYSIYLQREQTRTRIGQFAIGISPYKKVFADGLQLLPEYRAAWTECMRAVLKQLGPGLYVYGSDWSLEPPQEHQISTLPGVTVRNVKGYVVEAIDFARWSSWEDYEQDVSSNIGRNIKKAKKTHEDLELDIKHGVSALAFTSHLFHCKAAMLKRKAVPFFRRRLVHGHILHTLLIPQYAFCAILRTRNRILAAFSGIEVGRQIYYFDGGSMGCDGTGWLLKMSLMQDFFRRHPTGRALMGSEPHTSNVPSPWQESGSRYRRDARVSAFPTSIVTFTVSKPSS